MSNNLLAGLLSSIWTALVGLVAIPFYLKYLGIESYGLIGFFVTFQVALTLLDMGMGPTISRQVARCVSVRNLPEAARLLHTFAVIYWIVAAMIAVMMILLSEFVAKYWLQANTLSTESVSRSVALMGLVVAARWPIGLYQGALIGAQRMTISSTINILMTTLASFGAIAVLALVSPTIEAFFAWQAVVGIMYSVCLRRAAWRVIGSPEKKQFDLTELKRVWRFSASMTAVAISAIIFTQLDKLILSKTLSLAEFGHYMLATVIVNGLYLIFSPVFNVVYPKFSILVVDNDATKISDVYRTGTRMLSSVLFPAVMFLAVFSKELVGLWTGDPAVAAEVGPIIVFLAMGSSLHGVMYFPYALQLAYGTTRLPLTINAILLVLMVPMVVYLSFTFGGLGGAIAWFILIVLYVLIGTYMTHRVFLKGLGFKWLTIDVGVALALSTIGGWIAHYSIQTTMLPLVLKLGLGIILSGAIAVMLVAISPAMRAAIFNNSKYKNRDLSNPN